MLRADFNHANQQLAILRWPAVCGELPTGQQVADRWRRSSPRAMIDVGREVRRATDWCGADSRPSISVPLVLVQRTQRIAWPLEIVVVAKVPECVVVVARADHGTAAWALGAMRGSSPCVVTALKPRESPVRCGVISRGSQEFIRVRHRLIGRKAFHWIALIRQYLCE